MDFFQNLFRMTFELFGWVMIIAEIIPEHFHRKLIFAVERLNHLRH